MSKFTEQEYGSTREILKFPDHYVAIAVTVDDEGVTANAYGKKIVPKGTIVGGKDDSVFSSLSKPVANKIIVAGDPPAVSAVGAEGVLMNDVDVTYGPKEGAMIIHGFVAIDKLPYDNPAEVVEAVSGIIPYPDE